MTAANGATSTRVRDHGVIQQRFVLPITTPSSLLLEDNPITHKVGSVVGGRIQNLGSIKFLKTQTGKALSLGGFVLNFGAMKVYATTQNGDPLSSPVAMFRVHIINPPLYPAYDNPNDPTTATVAGLRLNLAPDAATLLNNELSAQVFVSGMKFGHLVSFADLT
jgi:hypothetical protein